jgi:hypothetical protein
MRIYRVIIQFNWFAMYCLEGWGQFWGQLWGQFQYLVVNAASMDINKCKKALKIGCTDFAIQII